MKIGDDPKSGALPVLLVDDEPQILLSSKVILKAARIKHILTIDDSRQVLPFLENQEVAVIVLDLGMPHLSGKKLLFQIKEEFPNLPIIVMTAVNELDLAVECMKNGAFDYLVKPVEKSHFVASIKRALEIRGLHHEVSVLRKRLLSDKLEHDEAFKPIIAKSKKMRAIFQYVEAIERSVQPVLISGETGVGKELIARSVHELSGIAGDFFAVNVAGLDDNMFSDTLFGHKKGAYTGAVEAREGLISKAAGGTLFLDEIGDLNELSQIKLLRLLQEDIYYPLGSDVPKQSDARIVAATNRNLQKLIVEGKFRKDLFYRLCAHQINIPPLRERIEDLPLLFDHNLNIASNKMNKKLPAYPPELLTLLSAHHFPGNIRELQALIFDAVARHKSGILSMESFRQALGKEKEFSQDHDLASTVEESKPLSIPDRFPSLKEAERYLISEALKRSNGNQGIAANLLGIQRKTLNKRLSREENPS